MTAVLAVGMTLAALLLAGVASARPNATGSIAAHKVSEPLPPVEATEQCDFIADPGNSVCMLPFPDDYYTVADPSSATGRRIAFTTEATPTNVEGKHIEAGAVQRVRRLQPRLGDPREDSRASKRPPT